MCYHVIYYEKCGHTAIIRGTFFSVVPVPEKNGYTVDITPNLTEPSPKNVPEGGIQIHACKDRECDTILAHRFTAVGENCDECRHRESCQIVCDDCIRREGRGRLMVYDKELVHYYSTIGYFPRRMQLSDDWVRWFVESHGNICYYMQDYGMVFDRYLNDDDPNGVFMFEGDQYVAIWDSESAPYYAREVNN